MRSGAKHSADAKHLAEYLVTLACSPDASPYVADAPYIARGLIRNERLEAAGMEIATVADRLRRGKADPKTCRGVVGFTEMDWAQLDEIVARVQEAAAKTAPSQPGARPDVPGAP
jgi:hypothetical protein